MDGPKVIMWDNMVSAAAEDQEYAAVTKIVLDGGEGLWPKGTEGIKKQRDHLSMIDGIVIF